MRERNVRGDDRSKAWNVLAGTYHLSGFAKVGHGEEGGETKNLVRKVAYELGFFRRGL